MSFKRTQDDCTMFHNHLVTLKKFLALTLNPVEVTVVRSVCLMLVLCGMLVHAGLASRAVGWPLVFFFLQVMQSRDYPQSVNLIAFLLSGFDCFI